MSQAIKTSNKIYPSLSQVAIVAGAFKILLWPAYKSTDFEVHRNWLAITHTLPVKEWYYEKTSEWTLDYPPFFAYFEWLLSQPAKYIDPGMLNVGNLNYSSDATIYFQRTTVLFSELLLLAALYFFSALTPQSDRRTTHLLSLSVLLSPGLLIIDHIHFQYNGAMYGILLFSLLFTLPASKKFIPTMIRERIPQSNLLLSGLLFAALLCMKHIYLYLAPAYFVFLLRSCCLVNPTGGHNIFATRLNLTNCILLGGGIASIGSIAFGPFILWGQIGQVISRLFPFARGLCHAYWAANVWALYSALDRVGIAVAPLLKISVKSSAVSSATRGLIGDTAFAVLPEITPRMTFILTLVAQIPPLFKLFIYPTTANFIATTASCAYASFLFGWHVHEKAILLVLIPFTLLLSPHISSPRDSRRYFSAFVPLAVAGHVALFPLLYEAKERVIAIGYTLLWLILSLGSLSGALFQQSRQENKSTSPLSLTSIQLITKAYIAGFIPILLYVNILHSVLFSQKWEFIPLALQSTYCAIGVVGSWIGFTWIYFNSEPEVSK